AMSALGRIEPEGDEVEAILLGLLKDGSVEERILAAEHAATARSMAALPALLEHLQHASMPVRSASVQALAKIRARQSIEPLIEALGRETGRMRDEVARALYAVTGLPYYDLVDVWRKWWAKEGASFKLPAEDPPPFDPERKGNYYYGIPVVSERIVFLVDASSSMESTFGSAEGMRFDVARKQLLEALKRLPQEALFNIVFFDTTIEPWQPKSVTANSGNLGAAEAFVKRQKPRGSTNIYDALMHAFKDPDVDTIYLLSDGAPTAGKLRGTGAILADVRWRNRTRKIVIHTIAVGMKSGFLERLASENGGVHAQR
ncbi:MAG: HEAT repeat domain-containing protein, partial [Planctomycetota bacterium]